MTQWLLTSAALVNCTRGISHSSCSWFCCCFFLLFTQTFWWKLFFSIFHLRWQKKSKQVLNYITYLATPLSFKSLLTSPCLTLYFSVARQVMWPRETNLMRLLYRHTPSSFLVEYWSLCPSVLALQVGWRGSGRTHAARTGNPRCRALLVLKRLGAVRNPR